MIGIEVVEDTLDKTLDVFELVLELVCALEVVYNLLGLGLLGGKGG